MDAKVKKSTKKRRETREHEALGMGRLLAVGFGDCIVKRDGEIIYSEIEHSEKSDYWTAKKAEKIASKNPNHDWRIIFDAPFHNAEYQRQGVKHWVLISKGPGFA